MLSIHHLHSVSFRDSVFRRLVCLICLIRDSLGFLFRPHRLPSTDTARLLASTDIDLLAQHTIQSAHRGSDGSDIPLGWTKSLARPSRPTAHRSFLPRRRTPPPQMRSGPGLRS
ncbi:hypothetical protein BGW36DRAFT_156408 [Talaromyces proteolyticus]|uniref:Uncharacterized protein n=1 Tax=Talaromyces proteolyticus TaxID=1131652 RepID=A0AAD4KS81_9EURO|nr:uncharacterized protein BGW36DRAFT_156408 [Talaromyces proteolyticus]KAH8699200.1 hypothetical protein BGW36DRAFT_156408 [Talaromyces proteolyticus]